jgi:ABC-type multidrug transport system permease subunit
VILVFLTEKSTVTKELTARAYHLLPYYLSKIIAEIPFNLINPIIFVLICYFIIGLQITPVKFFIMMGVISMEVFAAIFLGISIAAVAPDFEIG